MGYGNGVDGLGRDGESLTAEQEIQTVSKILGDLGWWERDKKNPLVFGPARLGLSTREGHEGIVQVSCVHTMAPDPEQCPSRGGVAGACP